MLLSTDTRQEPSPPAIELAACARFGRTSAIGCATPAASAASATASSAALPPAAPASASSVAESSPRRHNVVASPSSRRCKRRSKREQSKRGGSTVVTAYLRPAPRQHGLCTSDSAGVLPRSSLTLRAALRCAVRRCEMKLAFARSPSVPISGDRRPAFLNQTRPAC
eukprot:301522-Chlamydomonas_euryale.AAC.5